MGLFDFASDVGRRLFSANSEAAKNIKQHLEIKTTGIENLDVKFDDGTVTLCGDCANASVRDLAILIAGDIKGVERVDAVDLNVPESETQQEAAKHHIVESGDTLGFIAKRYYGKASLYMRIFEANRGLLSDPDKIYPGQKILIPPLDDV